MVIYRDIQKFNQIWIVLLILIPVLLAWSGFIYQIILHHPFGNNPVSDLTMLIVFLMAGIILPVFFFSNRLIVEIRNDGIYFKFFPYYFRYRRIGFDEIESYEIKKVGFFNYGGIGIKYARGTWSYTVKTGYGVEFKVKDKKHKILIGVSNPEEFLSFLRSAFSV